MIKKTVLTVDGEVGVGVSGVLTSGTTGAPVIGDVLQEARRMPIVIARTIQKWRWNWPGDLNCRYIRILSLSKMNKDAE
jgi:hypothetical protein